jgi:bacteriophage HK97-gp10 putative tail-component
VKIEIQSKFNHDALRRVKKSFEDAVEESKDVMVKEAKARAPVVTGRLRDSIHATDDGVVADAPYAAPVEFGTRHQAPQPYSRRSPKAPLCIALLLVGLHSRGNDDLRRLRLLWSVLPVGQPHPGSHNDCVRDGYRFCEATSLNLIGWRMRPLLRAHTLSPPFCKSAGEVGITIRLADDGLSTAESHVEPERNRQRF